MAKYKGTVPECAEWQAKSGQSSIGHIVPLSLVHSSRAGIIDFVAEAITTGTPRVLVGVVEPSGAGKSSLINALLDHTNIVPCSSMRASTAVAVEIAWNTSTKDVEQFRAEIEFVSEQEW